MTRLVKWWLFLGVGIYLFGILTAVPLPRPLEWCRPHWLLMFVIYCQIMQPRWFNPWWGWLVGLLLDGLLATPLGEHALIFSFVSYLVSLLRPRFLAKPLTQQVGKVFLLVALAQILDLWFHVFVGQNPHTLVYWMGTLTSCLVWPLLVISLNYLTHFFVSTSYRI